MFLDSATQFWSDWGLRISVLVSVAVYALLGLLSGARRRRSASGSLRILQWALGAILWTFYQFAEIAATNALGNLSLSGADASGEEQEQQLTAFWAPFLLIHLGGPDNLTAYALEDNMFSLRKMVEMALQLLGVMYAIWNYIYRGHNSRVLLAASAIVFVEGAARYVERACALWRANLDNMQEQEQDDTSKKPAEPAGSSSSSTTSAGADSSSSSRAAAVESTISTYEEGRALDDGEALLLAQDLFHVCRRFLVDSSVDQQSPWQRASEKLLSLRWSSMCKVVEMELSLMYEVLYTKATVAHTWPGYLIRFTSPVCAAAAASLFWLHRDHHGRAIGASFVRITYLLLVAAFVLDVVWLLRALGSTWTYAFLKKTNKLAWRRPWAWFHHQALFAGWWLRLHCAVVYLDPLWLFGIDPVAHRMWSGTIGRYNLLHECTVPRRPWRRWLATKLGLQDNKYLSELPPGVKQLLFERVQRILPTAGDNTAPRPDGGDAYTMVDITTCWGQVALRRGAYLFRGRGPDEQRQPILGREFEQDVLVWHIATCIFLSRAMVRKVANSSIHAPAIEAMSEYLMFLVAERRQMLPGLVLHSQLEETRRALEEIWNDGREGTTTSGSAAGGGHQDDKDKLAWLVRQKRKHDRSWLETQGSRRLVLDAAEVAGALTKGSLRQRQVVPMLGLIFNVWVDKLLYAAVRCSRESHAKQLSRGGELTTLLWIVIQHAGPFRIGQHKPGYQQDSDRQEMPVVMMKPGPKYKPVRAPFPRQGPQYEAPKPKPEEPPPPAKAKAKPEPKPPPQPKPEPKPAPPPLPEPEEAEDEVDTEDAEDYDMPIRYVTLY